MTHTTEKQLKNVHAFDLTDTTGVEICEARPPKRAKYTVEQIVDTPGPQHHEDLMDGIQLRRCILLSASWNTTLPPRPS